MLGIACAVCVQAETTIDSSHPHAYAANAGWINVRGDVTHGAVIGQAYCTGSVWSANCGWICLGNGPTNGWQYSNTSATDWGVNHDGQGNLTGYAYGANIGWIAFEQTRGQPKIDLRTGIFSGSIWSANLGWISLNNAEAYVRTATLAAGPDADSDTLPDAWEASHTNNPAALGGGTHDADDDGAPDVDEYLADTDPLNSADHLQIVGFAVTGATHTVRWTTKSTRLYTLEATNSLAGVSATAWPDAGTGLLGPPAGSTAEAVLSGVANTTRFYRVRAVLPLAP